MLKINIAIDGPAGAGKSTIAKILAKELNMEYIDSGALYRAITIQFMGTEVERLNESDIVEVLDNTIIKISNGKVYLNGRNITWDIRSESVSKLVSKVAAIKKVRDKVNAILKEWVREKGIIMDGRDVGTVIIPNADFKFYITATVDERAKRRFKQLKFNGQEANLDEIKRMIILRDSIDSQRVTDPLRIADDAIVIDSTSLDLGQVVDYIKRIIMGGGEK
jgi:cytidylate kinase